MRRSAPIFEDPIIFDVDHPFAFNLVYREEGNPVALFGGRILDFATSAIVRDEL
jgi:hypothetical protein